MTTTRGERAVVDAQRVGSYCRHFDVITMTELRTCHATCWYAESPSDVEHRQREDE